MPDVKSNAASNTRVHVFLDIHKSSITAGVLPHDEAKPEIVQLPNTEKAIRKLVKGLGDPKLAAVCYEAGPCGYEPYHFLTGIGVACDIVAPSLIPIRPGQRVKTDKRDARKGASLYRSGELSFVHPPSKEQEGLRDLVRCRGDIREVRMSARHRVVKQLLRYGHIYTQGRSGWTKNHVDWIRRQQLDQPNAQRALEHMLCHLEGVDAELAAIDHELDQLAKQTPWSEPVSWLMAFRGVSTLTAMSLVAEIGDFRRFSSSSELAGFLGLTPSEYSSGGSKNRGRITKTGNRHVRRLMVEASWHYAKPPRQSKRLKAQASKVPTEVSARAWHAQIRLNSRYRSLIQRKPKNVVNVSIARELVGFIWATMTEQPLREEVAA